LEGAQTLDSRNLETIIFYEHHGRQLRLQNQNSALNDSLSYILTGAPALPAQISPPMRAMQEVTEYVRNKLETLELKEILILNKRLINQAKFIWVDLATEVVNRYLAFDAINYRGLPLSEFDKIKNFCILVDQTRELKTNPEDEWYKAISQLEAFDVSSRKNEAAFITELYSSFHGELVISNLVHSKFVKKYHKLLISSNPGLESDLKTFIGLWGVYAKSFGFISTTKDRSMNYGTLCSSEAGTWLDRLANMDLQTITRSILTASHLREGQNGFEKIVRACEILTFRVYATMKFRVNKNAIKINRLARDVLRVGNDHQYIVDQICIWLEELAPIKKFLLRIADGEAKYNYDPRVTGWNHCYYFLYEYEIDCSPVGVKPFPWATQKMTKVNTQEHILPQGNRDGDWWEGHWPDEAEAESFKHRLGNLVLTSGNLILSRKPFDQKLSDTSTKYYYNHSKATNTEKLITNFTNGTDWLKDNILAREVAMIKFAAERWSMPCCFDNGVVNLPEVYKDNCYGGNEEDADPEIHEDIENMLDD
jgi:hypothetical protein